MLHYGFYRFPELLTAKHAKTMPRSHASAAASRDKECKWLLDRLESDAIRRRVWAAVMDTRVTRCKGAFTSY